MPKQNFLQRFINRTKSFLAADNYTATPDSSVFTIFGAGAENANGVSAAKAMDSYYGWVYACVKAISEQIANMKLKVMHIKPDGTVEQLQNHEILDSLNAMNDQQTGYDVRYKLASHLELTGNAYWYLEGVKDELSKPTAIYPLNPGKVKINIDRSTFPYRVTGFTYTDFNKSRVFKPYEILHFQYPNPSSDTEGIGTAQAAALWIDADNAATEVNRRFFINGARIGGFLESETGSTPAQLDFLKKSFENVHRGVDAAYSVAALPKGVKYTPSSTTPKDMDFAALGDAMMVKILASFRVPKSVLGVVEDVNRANAESTNYIFASSTIKPKMQLICSFLNEFYVPRFGDDIYLDFDDPVPDNEDVKIRKMQAAVASQPVMTQNEARQIYFPDLEPVENGDAIMVPSNLVPLGTDTSNYGQPAMLSMNKGMNPEEKTITKKVIKNIPTNNIDIPVTSYSRNAKKRKDISETLAAAAVKALDEAQKKEQAVMSKSVKEMTGEDWNVMHKAFITRVTPYETKVTDLIKKLNNSQKDTVKRNLAKAIKSVAFSKTKSVDKTELFDLNDEIKATIDLVGPTAKDLYETEGKKAAKLVGVDDMDLLDNDALAKALDKSVDLLATSYNETTLDALKTALDKGISDGYSLPDLTDMVEGLYTDWNDWRAATVARTETFRIANNATKDAWKQTGVVKTMIWHTAEDEMVCEYCAPMDGKEVPIDNNFFDKGDTVQGTDGDQMSLDYDNVTAGSLHANCRCYIRPGVVSIDD